MLNFILWYKHLAYVPYSLFINCMKNPIYLKLLSLVKKKSWCLIKSLDSNVVHC